MKFIFVDEIGSNQKDTNFFGVGTVTIDTSHYKNISSSFSSSLDQTGWNPSIEFKGKYLFSSSQGDTSVAIDQRIDLVHGITSTSTAKFNARVKFNFAYNFSGQNKQNYHYLLEKNLEKVEKPSGKQNGKDLVTIFYDNTNMTSAAEVSLTSRPLLAQRNMYMVEQPIATKSCNETPGVIFADVFCYLAHWDILNPSPNQVEQLSLFEIPPEQPRKIDTIRSLIQNIKSIKYIKG